MPSRIGHNSIVSSTLIEDVIPQRQNSQLNRVSPLENGQHALLRDDHELDEGSSSQSRDKSTNPFTLNNDSSVVNFSAHLQRAKSLFTNRSYVNQKLKNYRMRNPRSALYRSTSSLCDNNSISSNASSAMSSPFYNGETKFGGASATSRRLNSTFQNDVQQQMYHRPKIPTNLVASRSTSSLNTMNSSASMSNTTRRILDVMSKYSTPLTEVRRISNALPSISETSVLSKRKSLLEPDLSLGGSEIDRTKRALLKPNTPYNRPFGRNPVDSILTTELHVPTMPELLQLKKFATSTIEIRAIANNSKSVLNKPISNQPIDSKQIKGVNSRVTDLDISNNNEKVVNKNNDTTSGPIAMKEHKNKIRTSFMKRKMGKGDEHDSMPEPVNLPNVTLQMDKKIEIKFPEPFIPKSQSGTTDIGSTIPFKSKGSNTTGSEVNLNAFQIKSTPEKQINGRGSQAAKKIESVPAPALISIKATTPSSCSTTLNSDLGISSQPTKSSWNITNTPTSCFVFNEPIVIAHSSSLTTRSVHNIKYKFSEPLFVDSGKEKKSKVETTGAFNTFKFDSKPVNKITSDSGIADTTQSFGTIANKSTGLMASSSTFPSGKGLGSPDFAKIISNAPTQPSPCDTFKTISAQQKKDKWDCETCCVSNEANVPKCVCCQTENKKALVSEAKADISTIKPKVDEGFKSLIAQQTQGKWECDACLARNDKSLTKCVSCETPNPNASSESKNAEKPQKIFSFGSSTAKCSLKSSDSSIDDTFKSIVEKQKSSKWECSVCTAQNDLSAPKCICCNESKVSEAGDSKLNSAKLTTSQFSFGSMSALSNTNSTGFSFGPKIETSSANTQLTPFGNAAVKTNSTLGQFSFGNLAKTNETTVSLATETDQTVQSAQFEAPKPSTSLNQLFAHSSAISADKGNTLQASDNDLFKKIVAEQNSKWECTECMIKNEASTKKCLACETPKSGSSTDNSSPNVPESLPKPTFSFGLPIASSKTFSFGSQSDKKEEKPAAQTSIFGSALFNKPSVTFQFGSSNNSTTTSSVPFAINSTNSAFSATANQSTIEEVGINTKDTETKILGGFNFSFGATSNAVKTVFSSSENCSKDVIDLGSQSAPNTVKNVTVTENILLQPPTNGSKSVSDASKTTFSLGQCVAQTVQETIKAPDDKPKFAFGKSESLTASSFAFNSDTTPISFSEPQPTFSTPSFSFVPSSAIPTTATNQPVFGSNTFATPTLPTLNTFTTNNTFGTNHASNATSQLRPSSQVKI